MENDKLAPTDENIREAFLKRFTGVNGKCRICGAEPDQSKPKMVRAIWYATHGDPTNPCEKKT